MVNSSIDWAEVRFTKSSYSKSDGGECVEIGAAGGILGVRDSKLGASSTVLELSRPAFAAFLAEVKTGPLDQPSR